MKKILFTLCLVKKNNQLLLGYKKQGLGTGRWNGFGGKVEPAEEIEAAARRELFEEAGIRAGKLKRQGILNFEFEDEPKLLEVHVFSAEDFSGEPTESAEMKPRWFNLEEIPYDEMWPDDRHWLPLLLEDKNFEGDFYFKDNDTLARCHIFQTPKP